MKRNKITEIYNGIKCHLAAYEKKFNKVLIIKIVIKYINKFKGSNPLTLFDTNFEFFKFNERITPPRKIPTIIIWEILIKFN